MNIQCIRDQFPVLNAGSKFEHTIFFDGAAGTQVSNHVIDRMTRALVTQNSNLGGVFPVSHDAVELVNEARQAMAAFFNARDTREVVFGQNMTTMTLAMSRNIGATLHQGDEIILTRMDHDANVAPWLRVAEDRQLVVKWLDFNTSTFEFDLEQLDGLLSERTKLVAFNYASNLTGTINDIATVCRKAKSVGALVYVDAVQYAPHGVIDVQALGCDFLVCSAYKFYGPHHGILWGRLELLESMNPYKVRAASDSSPDKFETGTKSREALAGVLGAVEHFEWIGTQFGGVSEKNSRRERIIAGIEATKVHEDELVTTLLNGLKLVPAVKVIGITDLGAISRRVPTISFVVDGRTPEQVCKAMNEAGINIWNGHNYGIEPCSLLNLLEGGGVVRLSLAQYNTQAEVERFLQSFYAWMGATA